MGDPDDTSEPQQLQRAYVSKEFFTLNCWMTSFYAVSGLFTAAQSTLKFCYIGEFSRTYAQELSTFLAGHDESHKLD